VPERRRHIRPRPNLDHLVHAVLIGYPRYLDPLTNVPCPPEIAVDRLARGQTGRGPLRLRALGRLQGALAGFAWLWR
jgi:capsular polysaccharide export protein